MPYNEITPMLLIIKVIEVFAHIYLLNSILHKRMSKMKYILATLTSFVLYEIVTNFIPANHKYIAAFLTIVPIMAIMLKVNVYKVFFGYVITTVIIALLDLIGGVILMVLLDVESFADMTNSTTYYYFGMFLLSILILIVAFSIRYFKMTFTDVENDNRDLGIAFNSLLTLLFVFPSVLIIIAYVEKRPLSFTAIMINLVSMLAMLVLSIYNSQKRYNLILSQRELECQKNYNTTLKSLVDGLRTFKHDYTNTLATLSGYVQLEDMKSLKRVFKEVLDESRVLTTLDKLNLDLIKNPNIYGLITTKYEKCERNNVTMNLEIFADFDNTKIKTFDLTRILGIFLDNAIEAASGSEERKVNLLITENNNKVIVEISNTYSDKAISVEKIYEKGISSKGSNRGLGLYKVKDIVKKYPTVSLKTVVDEDKFLQRLTIDKVIQ